MITGESLHVRLPVFEGPLDLLYTLIRKHELEISEISLALIADEFVAHLENVGVADLAAAGNVLSIAGTLMYLKSKWLLPPEAQPPEEEQEGDVEPLLRRLADYQKLRELASSLAALEDRARASFPRPLTSELARRLEEISETEPFIELTSFELLKAIKRVQEFAFPPHREVSTEEIPTEVKIEELTRLMRAGVRLDFSAIMKAARSVLEAVVFFLAALELARQRFLYIRQKESYGGIHLAARELKLREITVSRSKPKGRG